MDRHLSPAETARRFGVSIKALRLYEQHGLLTPLRSEVGWRTYGPDQIARLHQILALKRLGLPLTQIAELLAGTDRLDSVLAIQEQTLGRGSDRLVRALALVRAARAKLAAGAALSIDDLATLTKETTMAPKLTRKTFFHPALVPHQHKYFTPEEIEGFANREDFDQERDIAAWFALFAELKALMPSGDPASPAALDLARRWRDLSRQFTKGDPVLEGKLRDMAMDSLADPATGPQNPLTAPEVEFLRKMMAALGRPGEIKR